MKKQMIIGAVTVFFIVIFAVPAVMLFRGISRFGDVETKLDQSVNSLEKYYKNNPFPSPENIARIEKQTELARTWYGTLVKAASRHQVISEEKSPSVFKDAFGRRRSEWTRLLQSAGVGVPPDFSFGMDRYFLSPVPPNPDDVPHLMDQLAVMDAVVRVLAAERVVELRSVRRDLFEKDIDMTAPGSTSDRVSSSRRGAERESGESTEVMGEGELPADPRYARLHFQVEFVAVEAVVRAVLNALAGHDMFMVVTDVALAKEKPDVLPAQTRAPAAKETTAQPAGLLDLLTAAAPASDEPKPAGTAPELPLSRRDRMVSGRGPKGPDLEVPLLVKLGFDVYQFRVGE